MKLRLLTAILLTAFLFTGCKKDRLEHPDDKKIEKKEMQKRFVM